MAIVHIPRNQIEKHIGDVLTTGAVLKFLQCAFQLQPALKHQSEAAAQALRFIQPMSAEDDRLAELSEVGCVFKNSTAADNIKTSGRFIHQYNGRIVHE
jgi:hypothetical protein